MRTREPVGARWRRLAAEGAVAVAVAMLFFSDLLSSEAASFWVDHPMAGAIVSGLALFLLAAVVIEEWLRRREIAQWKRVAHTAFDSLGTGMLVCSRVLILLFDGERFGRTATPLLDTELRQSVAAHFDARVGQLPPAPEARIRALADDPNWTHLAHKAVAWVRLEHRSLVARWAPLMLQTDRLAKLLNQYADIDEHLDREVLDPLWTGAESAAQVMPPAERDTFCNAYAELLRKSIEMREQLNRAAGREGWESPYRAYLDR